MTVQREGQRLRLVLPDDSLAVLWQAAAEVGVGIRHMSPEQEDIAQAFVRHLRLDDPTRREAITKRAEGGGE